MKIKTLGELKKILIEHKKQNKKIVHCHGVFDLIHPGHLQYFKEARNFGDVLVITISPDQYVNKGPGRPIFNQQLRAESLAALEFIDYVAVNESPTAVETILLLQPNFYVKGGEYKDLQDLTGNISKEKNAIEGIGGEMVFTNDSFTFSSTQLLNKYFSVFSHHTDDYLQKIRQNYAALDIIDMIKTVRSCRAIVIGDTIIDEYYFCQVLGVASKSTTINAEFVDSESQLGGAGAVANHVASFCDDVHFITCIGSNQSYENFILDSLKSNITTKLYTKPNSSTTIKRRYMNGNTRIFQLSILNQVPLDDDVTNQVCNYVASVVENYDIVIMQNCGHGFIEPKIMEAISQTASYTAINSQTNSANMGFNLVSQCTNADYLCLDEREIRLACRDKFSLVEDLIPQIAELTGSTCVTVTRGREGSITWRPDCGILHAPAFIAETIDSTGAGDTYFAVTAPVVAFGFAPELIGFIGNCAGAMSTRVLGNRESIDATALYRFITTLLK